MLEAADAIARERGGIDIWVNDAMVTVFAPVWELVAAFRCSPPIAAPNTRYAASPIHCAPNSTTATAPSRLPSSNCRQ